MTNSRKKIDIEVIKNKLYQLLLYCPEEIDTHSTDCDFCKRRKELPHCIDKF